MSEQDKRQLYIIKEDLKDLYHCQFPRYIGLDKKGYWYSDASKYPYEAAVYLRQENEVSCRVDLIFSKARLVPNKKIPRLELLAALIGKRCLKFVEVELKLDICKKDIWIDSQCVQSLISSIYH